MTLKRNNSRSDDGRQLLDKTNARSGEPVAEPDDRKQLDRMMRRTRYRRMLIALVLAIAIYTLYCLIVRLLVSNSYAAFLAYIAGAYLIVLGSFLYIDLPRGWRAFSYVIVITFFFLFLLATGLPPRGPGDKARNAEVKQNLHAILLAVKSYALEHEGQYPAEIGAGFLVPYESRYRLRNPFTEDMRFMRPVPLGAPEAYGDFTYVPVVADGRVISFHLYAYGSEHTRGMDIDGDGEGDHVILVLGPEGEEQAPKR